MGDAWGSRYTERLDVKRQRWNVQPGYLQHASQYSVIIRVPLKKIPKPEGGQCPRKGFKHGRNSKSKHYIIPSARNASPQCRAQFEMVEWN